MPVQTTYKENIDAGRAGQRVNTIPATMISRTVEEEAGLAFGVAVAQGSNDKGVIAFAGSGTPFGISIRERSLDANTPDKFGQYDEARIMTQGAVYVEVGANVSAGDPVFVTSAGAFTAVATDNTALAGAVFDTSATTGNLAQVRMA